jgi:hypothetical protein
MDTKYCELLGIMRIIVDEFVNAIQTPAPDNQDIRQIIIVILAMKNALEEDMVSDDPNPTLEMYEKAALEVKCFEDYIIESSKN